METEEVLSVLISALSRGSSGNSKIRYSWAKEGKIERGGKDRENEGWTLG